jgi:hypothetical protein
VFSIITGFIENEINWKNCIGICTDIAQSISGRNAELQVLLRKHLILSGYIDMGLQTVFQAVIRAVNYVKNSPLRGRPSAKLCDDMEAKHTALLCYCDTRWLSRAKVLHRVFELKEEIAIFLSESCNNDDAYLCYSEYFIQKLACLLDIFRS